MKKLTFINSAKRASKQGPAIAAILTHDSLASAARSVGLGVNTLIRWMKEPAFAAALEEARSRVFDHAVGTLKNAASEAAEVLVTVMRDKKNSVATRLHAAQMVLQHVKKEERGDVERQPGRPTKAARG